MHTHVNFLESAEFSRAIDRAEWKIVFFSLFNNNSLYKQLASHESCLSLRDQQKKRWDEKHNFIEIISPFTAIGKSRWNVSNSDEMKTP